MAEKNNDLKTVKTKSKFKVVKIVIFLILGIVLLSGIALGGVTFSIIQDSPALNVTEITSLSEPSVIYDDNEKFMDYVTTDTNRQIVPIKKMSKDLLNAVVAIEDERFYEHNGLDYKRLIGVVYYNLMSKINSSKNIQGGSTITQQLIKQRLFLEASLKERISITRKIQEMYLATKLETLLSKDQILETYLNTIFLGGQANGVEAASSQYFSVTAENLNLIQSAFIAGMGQSPSTNYPFSVKNQKDPSVYINRTKTVLEQLLSLGKITQQQYDDSIADIDKNGIVFKQSHALQSNYNYNYEYFMRPLINQITNDLKKEYSYDDKFIQDLLNNGGLKIYSSMNRELQDDTKKILNADASFTALHSTLDKNKVPLEQSAAVVIENSTGFVKSIVGGRGDQAASGYNRACQDDEYMPSGLAEFLKPTGSSIKPLTVYGPAIEEKLFNTTSIIDDSPLPNDMLNKYYKGMQPRNYGGGYSGPISVRAAITASVNVVAIKIEDKLGVSKGYEYSKKFNLNLQKTDNVMSAMALGQQGLGTTPLRMAAAYGVFANGGLYTNPRFYSKVVDKRGITILESKYITTKTLSPQGAYITYSLLKGPVSSAGSGPSAQYGNMPVAGKTGTSGDNLNLWFCGLTPYYSGAVWLGTDLNKPFIGGNSRPSSNSVANAWGLIMKSANKGKEIKDIKMPSGIVQGTVCKTSGLAITDFCREAGTATTDLFIDGTIPTALCNIHSAKIPVVDIITPPPTPTPTPVPTPTPTPTPTTPIEDNTKKPKT